MADVEELNYLYFNFTEEAVGPCYNVPIFQGVAFWIANKYADTTRSIKQTNKFTVQQPYSWASLEGVLF
jgi:hypothetical protein